MRGAGLVRLIGLLSSMAVVGVGVWAVGLDVGAQDEAGDSNPDDGDSGDESGDGETNPELQEVARRAAVVAEIGDVEITLGEVEDRINEQAPNLRLEYRDPDSVRRFVDSLVRFELLARAADRAGIDEQPEVQRTIKQAAVQQLIRRDFDQRITVDSVSDEDIAQYYETHPAEFGRAELRRAAHIRVETRAEAERLLEQARTADARQFRELARDHSVDPETRLRGGDLRFFGRDGRASNTRDPQVAAPLAAAAFTLAEVGDLADEPVQVGDEWSIVKLTGRRPAEQRSLAQASPTIRLRLWRNRRQQELTDFVAGLRRDANVEPDYDLLRNIRLDPPPREDADEDDHGDGPATSAGPVRRPEQTPPPVE